MRTRVDGKAHDHSQPVEAKSAGARRGKRGGEADPDVLRQLNELSSRLWRAQNLPDGLQEMLSGMASLLGADMASVQLIDTRKDVLVFAAHRGFRQEIVAAFGEVPANAESACGRALRSGHPTVIEDVESDPVPVSFLPAGRAAGYRAAHCTPLVGHGGAPLGMLCAYFRAVRRPSERELQKVDFYARQAADFIQRCGAEDALRASEESYRAVVESQAEMVCRFRPDGTILFANSAYAKARGTTSDRLIGRNFWDFVAADDRAGVRAMLDRLTPATPQVSIENRFETVDGERWTLWTNRALYFDDNGRLLEAQSTAIDITARKRSEEELARSARQMAALYELTDRLQRAQSLSDVYDAAIHSILKALCCDRGSILLFDGEGVMRFVAWHGLSESYRRAVEGHSPWQPDEIDPTPIGMNDVAAADLGEALRDTIRQEGIGALAFIPIVSGGRLIGKFMVYYDAPHAFNDGEFGCALTIARQVALALRRREAESQRQRAEEQLRQSEQELADFFQTAAIGLHWVDRDGIIRRVNQAELDMLGYSRDEYIGRHIGEFHVDPPVIQDILVRLRGGETLRDYPARMRRKDGSVRDVLINSSVLFKDGKFIHTRCFTLDVTESRKSEQALLESRRRLQLVSDHIPALIAYIDREHRYRVANARYGEHFGVAPESVTGMHMRELLGNEIYEHRLPYIERALLGETVRFEGRTIHSRLGARDTDLAYVPHVGEDGKVEGFYIMGFDITEHKRVGETIRSLLRISERLNLADDADTQLDILLEEALLVVGAESGVSGLCAPQGMVCHRYLQAGKMIPLEYCWPPMHGLPGWLIVNKRPYLTNDALNDTQIVHELCVQFGVRSALSTPILGTQGEVLGFFEVHNKEGGFTADDVDKLLSLSHTASIAIQNALAYRRIRETEESLREADRRKDEFLATLSHELRNPLAPLKNALSLLRLTDGENPVSAPVQEMMERQLNHLVRLVDDLLEMSRISRGILELRKEPVPLATVVRNAIETSDPLVKAAGHRLAVSLPDAPLVIDGDPVRLSQIISNLLNNAARYTPGAGEIEIRAAVENGSAAIRVRDNGIGIEPDALPRIFEMFARSVRPSGRADAGLGVGLPLARRLAEMHGGTLEARSEGRGKGCEFIVRLPLASEQREVPAERSRTERAVQNRRILVVDDNRDAADSLGKLLQRLGADVRVAHDGGEALRMFPDYDPSIVLLDIGMPGMDGYEVARRIRTGFPDRRTPLVALTGWGQEQDRRRARDAGFDRHLVKPADVEALRAVLASFDGR